MKPNDRFYIAYGSNLNLGQMAHRCPTAEVVGAAVLRNWRLWFRGGNGGAVATVERERGFEVPVLVWRIQPQDERALDRYEGWPFLYRKETLRLTVNGKRVYAMIYIMNEAGHPYGAPSQGYLDTIREGYENAGFDSSILAKAVSGSKEAGGMDKTVREQILAVRATGETNMLDTRTVQVIANRMGFYELVIYLEEHRRGYVNFILTGDAGEEGAE